MGQKVAEEQGSPQFHPISIVSIGKQCVPPVYFIHFSEMATGGMRYEWS